MSSGKNYLAILFLLAAALFVADRTAVFSDIRSSIATATIQPLVSITQAATQGITKVFESVFLLDSFTQEYDQIKAERDLYRGEAARLRAIQEENNFLRQALEMEDGEGEQLTLARIIATDQLLPSQEITLNKGSIHGVETGQTVILSGRILVGQIRTVQDTTSTVQLITAEQTSISATLKDRDETMLIKGLPSGALSLELVPRSLPLEIGEIVLTSGIGSTLPQNLLVGEVRRIINEDTASFQNAVVQPLFSPSTARNVFIMHH